MQPTKDGKKLYHIQSITEWSEDPYDMFVWSDHYPTTTEIKKLYLEDIGDDDDISDSEIQDFMDGHNVYSVYAEEL